MEEKTAFEVEAALIDAYPGLTNIVGGAGSNDFGARHAKEIIARYCAEPAVFQHRALLISVNRSATEASLYEATRYAWKISKATADKAEVVLATRQGLILDAFIADRWLDATAANFPGDRMCQVVSGSSVERRRPTSKLTTWEAGTGRVSQAWRSESHQVHVDEVIRGFGSPARRFVASASSPGVRCTMWSHVIECGLSLEPAECDKRAVDNG